MRFLPTCCLLVPSACHSRLSTALAAVVDQEHSPKFTRRGPTQTARISTPAGRRTSVKSSLGRPGRLRTTSRGRGSLRWRRIR